jgi:hypothetical protein
MVCAVAVFEATSRNTLCEVARPNVPLGTGGLQLRHSYTCPSQLRNDASKIKCSCRRCGANMENLVSWRLGGKKTTATEISI